MEKEIIPRDEKGRFIKGFKSNGFKGFKHSEEWKQEHSKKMKGRELSDEWKRKIGEANSKILLGTKQSEETKIKKGLSIKENAKTNPNFGMRGKIMSEETRNKMSIAKKGKTFSEDRNKKLSETLMLKYKDKRNHPNYGRKLPEEVKRKIGIANSLWEHPIGENASNWIDGRSYLPYSSEFNIKFKEFIRIRDGCRCLKCGMIEEDHIKLFNAREPIHHINYDKRFTIRENCCVLCIRCNSEVNSNREHWIKFFQSLLHERYGYNYTELNEPIIQINMEVY